MTLFESAIRKLNLPSAIIDGITAIRNICMEADEQPVATPTAESATDKEPTSNKNQEEQPRQQGNNQQTASTTPDAPSNSPDGNNKQEKVNTDQPTNKQPNRPEEEKINEGQVDATKLMRMFENYLDGCKQKVKAALVRQFGENGKIIIEEVEKYIKSGSPINFDDEIVPLLRTNDKEYPDQKVIDDVRNRLQKYFGLKLASPEQPPRGQSAESQKEDEESAKATDDKKGTDTDKATY